MPRAIWNDTVIAESDETEIVDVPSHMTLLQMLREVLVLTGTKNGAATSTAISCVPSGSSASRGAASSV